MIPIIERYIYKQINKWPVDFQQPLSLQPLFLSNVNYNFVESYPLITKVILWFEMENHYPSLVTKIMDDELEVESINRCLSFQKRLNEKIGYDLYPKIYDITKISEKIVLFEEAVKSPTYETELKYAICGPERSLLHLERVINRQFKEMGGLFKQLQGITTSDRSYQWGDWAFNLVHKFKATCGFNTNFLTDKHINQIRKAVDTIPMYKSPVLADLVCPNIFSGPRIIDNIIPDIDELNAQLPGVINLFRFIIPYFYSPPVNDVFTDWPYAIAVAINDRGHNTIIGPPLRDILRQTGFDLEQPIVIWSFIIFTTIFDMIQKLEFYSNSPFIIDGKKKQFQKWTKRLVEIQNLFNKNKKINPKSIIYAQNSLNAQGLPDSQYSILKKAILNLFPFALTPLLYKIYNMLKPIYNYILKKIESLLVYAAKIKK